MSGARNTPTGQPGAPVRSPVVIDLTSASREGQQRTKKQTKTKEIDIFKRIPRTYIDGVQQHHHTSTVTGKCQCGSKLVQCAHCKGDICPVCGIEEECKEQREDQKLAQAQKLGIPGQPIGPVATQSEDRGGENKKDRAQHGTSVSPPMVPARTASARAHTQPEGLEQKRENSREGAHAPTDVDTRLGDTTNIGGEESKDSILRRLEDLQQQMTQMQRVQEAHQTQQARRGRRTNAPPPARAQALRDPYGHRPPPSRHQRSYGGHREFDRRYRDRWPHPRRDRPRHFGGPPGFHDRAPPYP